MLFGPGQTEQKNMRQEHVSFYEATYLQHLPTLEKSLLTSSESSAVLVIPNKCLLQKEQKIVCNFFSLENSTYFRIQMD